MPGYCTRTTQIDFIWACRRITSTFSEFEILPLLSGNSQQIFCFVKRRKIKFSFYFLSEFLVYFISFFPSPTYFFLTAATVSAPVAIFAISDTYPGKKAAKLQSINIFSGSGLISTGFLKVPFILLPIIWEFCLCFSYNF